MQELNPFFFMKKLATKLTLNKTTIASLDSQKMEAIKGGFTYYFTTSDFCRQSVSLTARNRSECSELGG